MKKFIGASVLLCFAVLVLVACSGCTDNQDKNNGNLAVVQENSTEDPSHIYMGAIIQSFKEPAKVVNVDLNKEDPSNEQIKFDYDEDGRVAGCKYKIDGTDVYIGYIYKENQVDLYGFIGDVVVSDETFDISEYNSNTGFCEHAGYFFKGFNVNNIKTAR